MPTLYGIPNCETVKKARAELESRGHPYIFHDFKKQGVPEERLDAWIVALGWETLLNRRGTTWRRLSEPMRTEVSNASTARDLMLALPSVIRRPVVEWPNGAITVGYDRDEWSTRLGTAT